MERAVRYMKCFHVNELCSPQHKLRWLTLKNHTSSQTTLTKCHSKW